MSEPPPARVLAEVGLCSVCRHARVQTTARARFWRCTRADTEPAFRRYPPLPVSACPGFERASQRSERAASRRRAKS